MRNTSATAVTLDGVKVVGRGWVRFSGLWLAVMLLGAGFSTFVATFADDVLAAQRDVILVDGLVSFSGTAIFFLELGLPVLLVTMLLMSVGTAASAEMVDELLASRRARVWNSVRTGLPRALTILWTLLAVLLGVMAGILLTPFLVPAGIIGLILAPIVRRVSPSRTLPEASALLVLAIPFAGAVLILMRWSLAVSAAALEDVSARGALARSWDLTRGQARATVLALLGGFGLQALVLLVGSLVSGASLPELVKSLVALAVPVLAVSFPIAVLTVLFRRLAPPKAKAADAGDPPSSPRWLSRLSKPSATTVGLLILALASTAVAVTPRPAEALVAPIVVNDAGDGVDNNPGDEICLADSGGCTLRAALAEAGLSAGPDVINFSGDLEIIPQSTLVIDSMVTMDGAGFSVVLDGYGCCPWPSEGSKMGSPLLRSDVGATGFVLRNLTLRDGLVPAGVAGLESHVDGTLENVTFHDLAAYTAGGAVAVLGGHLALVNTTFSGNSAPTGGDIVVEGATSSAAIAFSTFAGSSGGAVAVSGGATATVSASIVAPASGTACMGVTGGALANADTDATCGTSTLVGTLGSLGDNGGSVPTIAIDADSNAVNLIPAADCVATDARGVARSAATCDLGAFEFLGVLTFDLVVNSAGDAGDADPDDFQCLTAAADCTLRAAIEQANAHPTIPASVTFVGDLAVVLGTPITVDRDVTITGTSNIVSVSGSDTTSIFDVTGDTVDLGLIDLHLTHGHTTDADGGGAIRSLGNVTLENVSFSQNVAVSGRGHAVAVLGGTLSILNGTLAANGAGAGHDITVVAGATADIVHTTIRTAGGAVLADPGAAVARLASSVVSSPSLTACSGLTAGGSNQATVADCFATVSADVGLGSFANHGGYVPTIALDPSSPAIDAVVAGGACPSHDARGVARPQLNDCDAGSFEIEPGVGPVENLTVNDAGDTGYADPSDNLCEVDPPNTRCTLRAAVEKANARTASGPTDAPTYVITFNGVTVVNLTAPIATSAAVTIDGGTSGVTIDGGNAVEVFNALASIRPWELRNLTVANGQSARGGAGVRSSAPGKVTNVTFVHNVTADGAADGGGAIAALASTLAVVNATFSANSAPLNRGGSDVYGTAPVAVSNATFFDSVGVRVFGSVDLVNSLFAWTRSPSCSGGTTGQDNIQPDGTCGDGLGVVASPVVGTFGDHGGPVATLSLLPDSEALDAGGAEACPAKDARGMDRDAACDVGASEYVKHGTLQATLPASSASGVAFDLAVAHRATFDDGHGSGTVTVTSDVAGEAVRVATLVDGDVTLSMSGMAEGDHQLTVAFPGDGVFPATSTIVDHTVRPGTTLSLVADATTAVFGEMVTFTSTISDDAATGDVAFTSSLGPVESAVLVGAVATLATDTLPVGVHDMVASHTGDAAVPDTSSNAWSITVAAAPTSLDLTGPIASAFGAPITLAADVVADAPSGATPAGSVTFYDGVAVIGAPVALAAGHAEITTSSLPAGARSLSAVYTPTASFVTSQDALTHDVSEAATGTVVTGPAASTARGQLADFDVVVARATSGDVTPTGTVVFYVDDVEVDRTALDGAGEATFSTPALAGGERQIRVAYLGGAGFLGSQGITTHEVTARPSDTALTGGSAGSVQTGMSVTYVIDVADGIGGGAIPTGQVQLDFGTMTLLDDLDAVGRASFTFDVPPLAGASVWVTGRYLGDAVYGTSQDVRSQDLAPAEVTVGLRADPVTSAPGQEVRIHVDLGTAVGGTPTGLVVLRNVDTGARIGEARVSGSRSFAFTAATSALPMGRSTIRATYTPDAGWASFDPPPTTLVFVQTATPSLEMTVTPALPERGTQANVSLSVGGYWGPAQDGTVTFHVDGVALGTVDVRLAGAGLNFPVGNLGTLRVQAAFSGNGAYTAASATKFVDVAPTPTVTQVTWNRSEGLWLIDVWNGSLKDGSFRLAAPSGQAILWVDGVEVDRGPLRSGAPLPLASGALMHELLPGPHEVTVTFVPNMGFAASESTQNYDLAKFTAPLIIDATGPVPWGDIDVGGRLLLQDPTAPLPTGLVTYELEGSSCTAPATGGSCMVQVDRPGEYQLTASYQGDENYVPDDSARLLEVTRKDVVVNLEATAPLFATGEPITVNWELVGPEFGVVTTHFSRFPGNLWVKECTGPLAGDCTAAFPFVASATHVPEVRLTFPGDELYMPVDVGQSVPLASCFVVAFLVEPSTASLTADPAPNCNGGTGYLDGTDVEVTAVAPPGVPQQWNAYWDDEYSGNRGGGEILRRTMTVGWEDRDDWKTSQFGQSTSVRYESAHCVLVTIEALAYAEWVDPVLDVEPNCTFTGRHASLPQGWQTGTEWLWGEGRNPRPNRADPNLREISLARGWFALGTELPVPTFSTNYVQPGDDLFYGYSIDGVPVDALPSPLIAGLQGLTIGATFGPPCVAIAYDAGAGGSDSIETDPNCANPWSGVGGGWLEGTDVSVAVAPNGLDYMVLDSVRPQWSANLDCAGCLDGFDRLTYQRSAQVGGDGSLRAPFAGLPPLPTPTWGTCRELVLDSQGSSATELELYNIAGLNGAYQLSCPNRSANDGWHAEGESLKLRVRATPGYLFGIWNDEILDAIPVSPFGRDQYETPILDLVMNEDVTLQPSFFTTEECTEVNASVRPLRRDRLGTVVTSLMVDAKDFEPGTVCPTRNVGEGPAEALAGLLPHARLTLSGTTEGGAALSGWTVGNTAYPSPPVPPTPEELDAARVRVAAQIAAARAAEMADYELDLRTWTLMYQTTPGAFRHILPPAPEPPEWMHAGPATPLEPTWEIVGEALGMTTIDPATIGALDPPLVAHGGAGSIDLNVRAYDAGSAVFSLCQEVVPAFIVKLADGSQTLGIDEDRDFIRLSPTPNCPFNDDAWLVGTEVTMTNVADAARYRLTRFGSTTSNQTHTFRLTGAANTEVKFADYEFVCHTLDVNTGSVKRTPAPNCPNTDASEGRYAAGTEVFLAGTLPHERVRQGWSGGDVILLEDDTMFDAPVVQVFMDQDRHARFNFREMTEAEKTGNFFEEAGKAITTGVANAIKKATGAISLGMKLYMLDQPPISYMLKPGDMFDAMGGVFEASAWVSNSVLDLLGVDHKPIGKPFCPPGDPVGSDDCSWFPKEIDATLDAMDALVDMALSGATCTAVWGMSGNGSYAGQAVTLIEEVAGLASSVSGGLTDGVEAAKKARLLVKRQEAFLATLEVAQQAYAARDTIDGGIDVLTDPNNEGEEGEFDSFEGVFGEIQFDGYESLTDLSAMAQCVGEQLQGTKEALAAIGM